MARDTNLATETFQTGMAGVAGNGSREELQGNGLAQFEIVGTVDLTHPALAQETNDSIPFREHGGRQKLAMVA